MRIGRFYITKETAIRIIVLVIALTNQILVGFGLSPFPFTSTEVEAGVSWVITVIVTVWTTYKNNDITPEAHAGSQRMRALKDSRKLDKRKEGDAK